MKLPGDGLRDLGDRGIAASVLVVVLSSDAAAAAAASSSDWNRYSVYM